ncbi:PepSY domain-containing protein [Porticoccaceae bacterium LTM1]|nr:PepSY domain-containing protein [Porticoccaceae bacterium LTM1]
MLHIFKHLMLRIRLLLVLIITVSALTASPLALADVSREQAGAIAQKQVGGKVLKITAIQYNKKDAFRVKLLKSNGSVTQVIVDAKSGRVYGGKSSSDDKKDKGKDKSDRRGYRR